MDYIYNKNMLVGIKGKIGSGKTTSAKILTEQFYFIEYAMADPIKTIAITLGFTKPEVYGTQSERLTPNAFWGVSGRHFLQKFGADVCRDFLPTQIPEMSDIWVRLFERFLLESRDKNIIISDVRFLSEEAAIRKHGGIIIEINRDVPIAPEPSPNDMDKKDDLDGWFKVDVKNKPAHEQHKSETEQDQIKADYIIPNTGTLEELTTKLKTAIIKHYLI